MVNERDIDPFGIGELLRQSAAALDNATTPAAGLKALAEALDMGVSDLPILGPFPQRQQVQRDLILHGARYQKALDKQLQAVNSLMSDCLTTFQESVAADEPATDEHAARWIAIAEPRYEAWLDEPATQDDIAELINAWSAYTRTLRAVTDDMLESLGIPSSRGLEDIANELQRLRRRHRQQMNALREEINALKTAQAMRDD